MLPREAVPIAVATGATARRNMAVAPTFEIGVSVITSNRPVHQHTRLPQYARGRVGEVVARRGGFVFADRHAHGLGECPEHLYSVRFTSQELWGRPGGAVYLDLWESHLDEHQQ